MKSDEEREDFIASMVNLYGSNLSTEAGRIRLKKQLISHGKTSVTSGDIDAEIVVRKATYYNVMKNYNERLYQLETAYQSLIQKIMDSL